MIIIFLATINVLFVLVCIRDMVDVNVRYDEVTSELKEKDKRLCELDDELTRIYLEREEYRKKMDELEYLNKGLASENKRYYEYIQCMHGNVSDGFIN